ncbi:MAG: thioredoxin domain-containing protein [Saccharofermentanales bacterium]|jgi:thioredoxin 1|nr:thioredoxin domain-containing protein [Eubacteriales bacterium]MDD3611217.1 thioredoxin domain-containing protein [Eubacteriales bacterium]NLW53921.1 thioredoxin [Clostridiaceae bacterium]
MFELDKKNFQSEVLESEGYVLVDFFGDGCEPCEALMPHILKYEETYGDKIRFTGLNTSKARRVAISQQVMGLPNISIYKDGERVDELVKDDATPQAVEEMIKKYI